jgi:hypothetical protein
MSSLIVIRLVSDLEFQIASIRTIDGAVLGFAQIYHRVFTSFYAGLLVVHRQEGRNSNQARRESLIFIAIREGIFTVRIQTNPNSFWKDLLHSLTGCFCFCKDEQRPTATIATASHKGDSVRSLVSNGIEATRNWMSCIAFPRALDCKDANKDPLRNATRSSKSDE